jgi:hypothetical protein
MPKRARQFRVILTVTTLIGAFGGVINPAESIAQSNTRLSLLEPPRQVFRFDITTESLDNPERGFSMPIGLFDSGTMARAKADRGVTMIRVVARIDEWRAQDLSPRALAAVEDRMNEARAAGVKLIWRFAYNEGPYPNSQPDANLDQIKRHIAQLKPLLRKHGDVIAWMEAGFIGAWGEWHSSTNGLDKSVEAKRQVVDALLDALPETRSVQLRYPGDIEAMTGNRFTAREAHTATRKARIGHHNDCFVASDSDQGTYGRASRSIAEEKAFIAQLGLYTPIGGETCGTAPPRSECATAARELELLGFSELNLAYHGGVLESWRRGGCFDEIRSRLGYRLGVDMIILPPVILPGRDARITMKLRNFGYAAPMLRRPVYLVLDGPVRRFFRLPNDPRKWARNATHAIDLIAEIPRDMPVGMYSLALWLPDDSATLAADPRFAVRLANPGVWDRKTGFNRLIESIEIGGPARVSEAPRVPATQRP